MLHKVSKLQEQNCLLKNLWFLHCSLSLSSPTVCYWEGERERRERERKRGTERELHVLRFFICLKYIQCFLVQLSIESR